MELFDITNMAVILKFTLNFHCENAIDEARALNYFPSQGMNQCDLRVFDREIR